MSNESRESRLLVVLGATGTQGGAVLRYFARQPGKLGFRLRGVSRNPSSATSLELQKLGIEMVKADLSDLATLKEAFRGATHVFANTDSNQFIFDALQNPEKLGLGQTAAEYGASIEKTHGQNVADAAASTRTLQRIVWSGLPSPKKWSKGRYNKVAMFDVKEEITGILQSKQELQNKLSVLMIGFYANNPLKVPGLYGPKKQADGVYELGMLASPDVPYPWADLESDAGSWVEALFQAAPGTLLLGASESLSWKQWLGLWGECNQVKTRYRTVPVGQYAIGLEAVRDAIHEEFMFLEDVGFASANPVTVTPDDLREKGIQIKTTPLADHIKRTDWSPLL